MMKRILLLLLLFVSSLFSQTVFDQADLDICRDKFEFSIEKDLQTQPIHQVITEIGKSFIGTDYKASTLEIEGNEKLVVNLTGLDCTTFIENVLIFSRLIKSNKSSFEDYLAELEKIRYRNGKLEDYTSRLHYFTDWIFDNEKKGILENISENISGEIYDKDIFFMSKNHSKYKQLAMNDKFVEKIKSVESEINQRKYFYIPQNKIKSIEDKIKSGYIIAFTTNIPGLDIVHVGIAVKKNDKNVYLMHAPNVGQKVQISNIPLSEYVAKNKKQTGIIVLKPLEPVED